MSVGFSRYGCRVAMLVAAFALLIVGATTSCGIWNGNKEGLPAMSDELLVGVWRGPDEASLTIAGDRTFQAERIRAAALGSAQTAPRLVSGSGHWKVESDVNDPSGSLNQVNLLFEELEGYVVPYSVNLRSDWDDDDLILFWFIGDPDLDKRYILEKD